MVEVKRVQPKPPPAEYVITIPAGQIETFVSILKCSTYGLSMELQRKLEELGVPMSGCI